MYKSTILIGTQVSGLSCISSCDLSSLTKRIWNICCWMGFMLLKRLAVVQREAVLAVVHDSLDTTGPETGDFVV